MSILVVGTTALDSIKTQKQENPRLLGGSASHAAVAASFFSDVNLAGVVGDDFPRRYIQLYEKHGINLEGLQKEKGKTFHWSGEYEQDMNHRQTLATELGVIEHYLPHLPSSYTQSKYVLLANIAPSIQSHVLDQVRKPAFVLADTMDLWLNIALDDLKSLLKKVDAFVLNDSEALQLTGDDNIVQSIPKIHKMGPKYVIVKKGAHGALLSYKGQLFITPAFPLKKVVDPTGAGDSFAGGLMGYLAATAGGVDKNIRQAVVYGTIVASFCCEGFGLKTTTKITRKDIESRMKEFRKMTKA